MGRAKRQYLPGHVSIMIKVKGERIKDKKIEAAKLGRWEAIEFGKRNATSGPSGPMPTLRPVSLTGSTGWKRPRREFGKRRGAKQLDFGVRNAE
jgi:hypothetical protein